MSQQPEALKHAEWLERSLTIGAPEAAAELRRLHAVEPVGFTFSHMWLAPLDGSPVMLYMPTTTDKFAVGIWHDGHGGGWGDDEGNYYTHEPVAFCSLANLERFTIRPAPQPQAVAASSPAQAVDAAALLQAGLSNDDLRAAFESKLPGVNPTERDLSIFALGAEVGAHELATERQSTRMYFEERNSARDAWRRAASYRDELRAALQASRQTEPTDKGAK